MNPPPDRQDAEPSPEQIEAAIEALQRGSPEALDRLLDPIADGSSGICGLFAEMTSSARHDVSPPSIPGYAIDRVIAAGGMGVVFAAEQSGTGRPVAVKVIRGGIGVEAPMDRMFRREVETLVRLRHPNIANLYDAGTTSEGAPFFAMEFIEGRTLKDEMLLSDDVNLRSDTGREAIRRFIDICRAMTHAHQRGVIHCDLKPTNVMIASDGTPKVLDFGLSRLIDPDVSTIAAASSHRLVGTIAYMSPEQVSGPIGELDIRSDVYSLGVMLYELVCGQPPYRASSSSIPAAIRMICETDPKRPASIRPALKGDLDAIVMKALEKDPDQRYQSAGELAEDLERSLRGEPIEARSDRFYLLRRTLYRYRVQALVAMAFFVVLAAASGISTSFWFQARRDAELAEQKTRQAKEAGDIAMTTVRRIMDDLDEATRGMSHRSDLLATISSKLDALIPLVPSSEPMRSTLCAILSTRASVAMSEGRADEARISLEQILEIARDLPNDAARAHRLLAKVTHGPDAMAHLLTAQQLATNPSEKCNISLAMAAYSINNGDYQEAVRRLDEVDCDEVEGKALRQKGQLLDILGNQNESLDCLLRAASIAERECSNNPGNVDNRAILMRAYLDLASSNVADIDTPKALDYCDRAIEIGEHLLWLDARDLAVIGLMWQAYETRTRAFVDLRDLDKAIEAAERLVVLSNQRLEIQPGRPAWLANEAISFARRGRVRLGSHDNEGAAADCLKARSILSTLLEDFPDHVNYLVPLSQVLSVLTSLSGVESIEAHACEYRQEYLDVSKRIFEKTRSNYLDVGVLIAASINMVECHRHNHEIEKATDLIESCDALVTEFKRLGGPDRDVEHFKAGINEVRDRLRKSDEFRE